MVFNGFFYKWTINADSFSMVFHISTIGIDGFSNGFYRWTIAIESMILRATIVDLSDGQFSERCDVDGSFFNSDAIPIIFGKA